MATVKVTVTLDEAHLACIREQVARGRASSVSGFVQHAVAGALDDLTAWRAALDGALAVTGGPMTDEEQAWADRVLSGASDPALDGPADDLALIAR